MYVVTGMPYDEIGRVAALLHDVGKTTSRAIRNDGHYHYWGHEKVGAEMARKILKRIECPEDTAEKISKMVLYHDTYLDKSYDFFTKIIDEVGRENFETLMKLQRSDLMAHAPWYYEKHMTQLNDSHRNLSVFLERYDGEK